MHKLRYSSSWAAIGVISPSTGFSRPGFARRFLISCQPTNSSVLRISSGSASGSLVATGGAGSTFEGARAVEEHDRCVQRSCKFSVISTGCACEYEKRIQVRVGNFETTADQRAVNQDRYDFLQFRPRLWVRIFETEGAWKRFAHLRRPLINVARGFTSRTRYLRAKSCSEFFCPWVLGQL